MKTFQKGLESTQICQETFQEQSKTVAVSRNFSKTSGFCQVRGLFGRWIQDSLGSSIGQVGRFGKVCEVFQEFFLFCETVDKVFLFLIHFNQSWKLFLLLSLHFQQQTISNSQNLKNIYKPSKPFSSLRFHLVTSVFTWPGSPLTLGTAAFAFEGRNVETSSVCTSVGRNRFLEVLREPW